MFFLPSIVLITFTGSLYEKSSLSALSINLKTNKIMPDLSINFAGINASNPFWLASGPPTNTAEQVISAFRAGWGGAVWKTIGTQVVNVSSRYAGIPFQGRKLAGMTNIELISDRSNTDNLRDIELVKKTFPDRPVVVSLMT